MDFKVVSDYQPTGDQPEAIDQLVNGIFSGIPIEYKGATIPAPSERRSYR